ncbi:MAG TPA: hypothetical protein VFK05_20010 [Polyangiaceae bacterium]|nr:hypothetical protein [Polyangiaceae bacterium]
MAASVALVILPVVAACLLDPAFRERSACCASALLAAAIWFRYRDRRGVEGVRVGLLAGSLPLALSLLVTHVDPACAAAGPWSSCTAFSLLIGGASGVLISMLSSTRDAARASWLIAVPIALFAASLGCLRLGVASVLGAAAGLVLGHAGASFKQRPT